MDLNDVEINNANEFFNGLSHNEYNAIETLLYRKSFYYFFLQAFGILEPETILIDNWHIKELCDILQEEAFRIIRKERKTKDIIINIPPRTLKSMITTVIFPVWCWTIAPHLKIITVSFNSDIAVRMSWKSRLLITSPWFQSLYSNIFQLASDSNSKSDYANNKNGFRKAVGIGGGVTGNGGDIIILDDPQDPEMAHSLADRKTVIRYWSSTLATRQDNHWAIKIVVMQRLHEEDLSGYLLHTMPERFRHLCLPAILTDEVSPQYITQYVAQSGYLSPMRLDQIYLDEMKATLGGMSYAGQFLQRPTAVDGDIVKREWLKIEHESEANLPSNLTWNYFVDTAKGGSDHSDGSAIICAAVYNNKVYIKYAESNRLKFNALQAHLVTLASKEPRTTIYLESATIGDVLAQELIRTKGITCVDLSTQKSQGRGDKMNRLMAITSKLEAKQVVLLYGSWNNLFIDEIIGFPNLKHDDLVDVLVMAVRRYLVNQSTRVSFVNY